MLMPFILLFALYVLFHGDYGPGGGFQAGVIFAPGFVLYGLVFGLDKAQRVVPRAALWVLIPLGLLLYVGVGVATMLLGGAFLDYDVLSPAIPSRAAPRDPAGRVGHRDHGRGGHDVDLLQLRRPGGGAMIATHYVYWLLFALMMTGLYVVISHGNLVKKLIGLSLFQVGVFLFFISLGKVDGGSAPIVSDDVETYSHPLPQVLILTAIVVGVATLAVGLALAVRIFGAYGTIEEDEVRRRHRDDAERPGQPARGRSQGDAPDDRLRP